MFLSFIKDLILTPFSVKNKSFPSDLSARSGKRYRGTILHEKGAGPFHSFYPGIAKNFSVYFSIPETVFFPFCRSSFFTFSVNVSKPLRDDKTTYGDRQNA